MFETPLEDETHDGITAELSEAERYQLFSNDQRRAVLDCLEGQTTVELDRLARDVTVRELGVDNPGESAIGRTRVRLHHVHLPMMADLGVIGYDAATHRITV